MKLLVSAAAAALLVASASAAQAGDLYYQADLGFVAGGKTDLTAEGVGTVSGDAKLGMLLAGSVGYALDNNLSVEAELLLTENGIDADDLGSDYTRVSTMLVMANAEYAFKSDKDWTPYVGAGVGQGEVEYEMFGAKETDNGLAWQLKAGVLMNHGAHTVDFGYRYLRAPEFKVTDGVDTVTAETGVHALTLGVRF